MTRTQHRWLAHGAALLLAGLGASALAQSSAPPPRIYSCTTPDGRKLTSDRPIAECQGVEQRVHRNDGAVRSSVGPALSPQERAAAELRQREQEAARVALADAARHDRNLLSRFPQQAAHDAARANALDDLVQATEQSQRRLADLAKERKALDDEAEFYKGKRLPGKLKQSLDSNEAAAEAQQLFIDQQGAERERVNRRYDVELARLKKLWAGAPPGSLGPPPSSKDWAPGTPAQAASGVGEAAAAAKAPATAPAAAVKKPTSSSTAR